MEILKGIEIKGKSLWFPKQKILIIADLHLGYEEAMNERGVLAPRTMLAEMKKEISDLLKLKPKTIIINGDLKHEFGKISRQEWKDANEILDLLAKNKRKIILIKGNHDLILKTIAERKGIETKDFLIMKDICITHGHKIFTECLDKKIKTIIIGHEHPSISLEEGAKKEKYKCFLLGKYNKKNLIAMPSFFTIFEGSDVLREKLLSPYLNERTIKNFRVFAVGDRAYRFGKLKDI